MNMHVSEPEPVKQWFGLSCRSLVYTSTRFKDKILRVKVHRLRTFLHFVPPLTCNYLNMSVNMTCAKTTYHWRGGRKGLRWCGFGLCLVRFCGNFYFNSRYCGFKTLSGLRLLQPSSRGFRWKKVSAVITFFRTVSIRLFCKREPIVLFYNESGFIISAYNLTLWFAITAFSS